MGERLVEILKDDRNGRIPLNTWIGREEYLRGYFWGAIHPCERWMPVELRDIAKQDSVTRGLFVFMGRKIDGLNVFEFTTLPLESHKFEPFNRD